MTIILIHGGMAVGTNRSRDLSGRPNVYVCICNGVTDKDIRQAALAGCRSVPELTMRTGCGACCGACLDMASEVLREAQQSLATHAMTELALLSNAA